MAQREGSSFFFDPYVVNYFPADIVDFRRIENLIAANVCSQTFTILNFINRNVHEGSAKGRKSKFLCFL